MSFTIVCQFALSVISNCSNHYLSLFQSCFNVCHHNVSFIVVLYALHPWLSSPVSIISNCMPCLYPLSAIPSVCRSQLQGISQCLSFSIIYHSQLPLISYYLSVITHCLSFTIVCHSRMSVDSPLSDIHHCLHSPLSSITNYLWFPIVSHSSLFVIHHCLSFAIVCWFTIVCHSLLSVIH